MPTLDCGHGNGRRNRLPHLAGSIVWRSRWGRRFACRWKLISIAHPNPENGYAPICRRGRSGPGGCAGVRSTRFCDQAWRIPQLRRNGRAFGRKACGPALRAISYLKPEEVTMSSKAESERTEMARRLKEAREYLDLP